MEMFGRNFNKDDLDRLEDKINLLRQEVHEMRAWKAELDDIRRLCDLMYQIIKKLGD